MKNISKRKHKCSSCNKTAVWFYMPTTNHRKFFCDDCVPRGCTCNLRNIKEDGEPNDKNVIWWSKEDYESHQFDKFTKERQKDSFYYEYVDEYGRREPCCEYDYDDQGYDIDSNIYVISKQYVKYQLSLYPRVEFCNKIMEYLDTLDEEIIYDTFMRKVYDICYPYMKLTILPTKGYDPTLALYIYNSFKYYCSNNKRLKEYGS